MVFILQKEQETRSNFKESNCFDVICIFLVEMNEAFLHKRS